MDDKNNTMKAGDYVGGSVLPGMWLVDVTPAARELGFSFPVSLSDAVWTGCISSDDGDKQEESSRLKMLLCWLTLSIDHDCNTNPMCFSALIRSGTLDATRAHLMAYCHENSKRETVITVVFQNEASSVEG